ncbi:MAG: hypothetical protein INR70_44650 [Parafilimonas terrae]|nr:hypothetical protein [Parafilimonas terrae]
MCFPRARRGHVGRPNLGISHDNLVIIVQLVVLGARRTRRKLYAAGTAFGENFITIELHKELLKLIDWHGYHHLAVMLEASLNTPRGDLGKIEGRIDLQVIFAENLRPSEYYFGVECKRLRPGDTATFRYYVDSGVGKYAAGTYSPGHPMGMLVGYLMAISPTPVPAELSRRVVKRHPGSTALAAWPTRRYRDAELVTGDVPRTPGNPINLLHAVVRMYPTAPVPAPAAALGPP